MKLKILQKDIDSAKRATEEYEKQLVSTYARAESCPIAFALKRLYPNTNVWVSKTYATVYELGTLLANFDFSAKTVEFIAIADKSDDDVKPTTVELIRRARRDTFYRPF